jgi:hypothetical protein
MELKCYVEDCIYHDERSDCKEYANVEIEMESTRWEWCGYCATYEPKFPEGEEDATS